MYSVLYILFDLSMLLDVVKRTIWSVEHYLIYEPHLPWYAEYYVYVNLQTMKYGEPYRIDERNVLCYRMTNTMFFNSIVPLEFTIYTN